MDIFNTTGTEAEKPESPKFRLIDLLDAIDKIGKKPVLNKMQFCSHPDCKLKRLYFDAFEKLPKVDKKYIWGGIEIKLNENLPENMMVWNYSNNDIRAFIYKDNKIYEIDTKFKPYENIEVSI